MILKFIFRFTPFNFTYINFKITYILYCIYYYDYLYLLGDRSTYIVITNNYKASNL